MEISDEVAAQARSPFTAIPEPQPEVGARRVLTDRYCAFLTPMPTVSFIEDLRLSPQEAAEVQQEVRALLREAGRTQAAWVVSSSQPELLEALRALGMTPYTDPPLEPHSTAMALTERPAWPPSPGVEVREAVALEDFVAMGELAARHFDMTEADAAAMIEGQRVRFRLLQEGRAPMRSFLAFLDGELVGEGQSSDATHGTNLSGSSVSPEARGRGVYRALVAARWDHAVARGIPALTIQAGAMSGPILEKLGFAVVDRQSVLCDRFEAFAPNVQVELTAEDGTSLGSMGKLEAHQGEGHLHRAFSVFLLDGDQVLLQRRASTKYHFAGLWTNSCCGHPAPGSEVREEAVRRTKQELGLDVQLRVVGDFRYRAVDPTSGLVEHELDTVLVGALPAEGLSPDPDEVSETRLVDLGALRDDLEKDPASYTPWLGQALELLSRAL